jgi:hypothetical protein
LAKEAEEEQRGRAREGLYTYQQAPVTKARDVAAYAQISRGYSCLEVKVGVFTLMLTQTFAHDFCSIGSDYT